MRATIRKSLGFAVVGLGLFAGSAQAQGLGQEMIVKVPFAFVVQGQTLPAGNYVVSRVTEDRSAMMIRGENANRKSVEVMLTMPADGHDPAGDKPALTFSRFENGYRLSTIWDSATDGRTMVSRKS
jgi:hypothetical protein